MPKIQLFKGKKTLLKYSIPDLKKARVKLCQSRLGYICENSKAALEKEPGSLIIGKALVNRLLKGDRKVSLLHWLYSSLQVSDLGDSGRCLVLKQGVDPSKSQKSLLWNTRREIFVLLRPEGSVPYRAWPAEDYRVQLEDIVLLAKACVLFTAGVSPADLKKKVSKYL